MTALAGIGLHEKLAGDFLLSVNLRGTGKKRPRRSVAFAIHGVGRHRRILDSAALLPALANVTCPVANAGQQHQTDCGEQDRSAGIRDPPFRALFYLVGDQKAYSDERDQNMEVKQIPVRPWRASLNENESNTGARCHEQPSRTGNEMSITEETHHYWNEKNRRNHSKQCMRQHHTSVENCRLGESVEVRCRR